MVIDHSFGKGMLTREDVQWPGSMADVREKIANFRKDWIAGIEALLMKNLLAVNVLVGRLQTNHSMSLPHGSIWN
ncbi:hypothetical protein [Paenibacillus sp. J2TS4]|uniref:hypothetical protein n=1 Tax=Paenibacillus sp. J2TS4 TaxID=2807194 RepID=UPI001AFFF688|nr:hypothetical protein [Paenibacillus sp. J2TS4]GIP33628.1 hypothetical protein J2TS4_28380 [Paenibacillus sp. J2TS4]